MSKKSMLLALSVACAAMLAVPAVASASEWHLTGGAQNFATHGGHAVLSTNVASDGAVTCKSNTGSGTVDATGKGGHIKLLFHSCTDVPNHTTCTTPGLTSGTIETTTADWTSVYLTHNKTEPGIKIFGTTNGAPNGHLATFRCGFGLVTIKVEGSVLGAMEPVSGKKCGAVSKTFAVSFVSKESGIQSFTQNTLTGEHTDLTVFRNGSPRTGAQDGTGQITLEKQAELNCT